MIVIQLKVLHAKIKALQRSLIVMCEEKSEHGFFYNQLQVHQILKFLWENKVKGHQKCFYCAVNIWIYGKKSLKLQKECMAYVTCTEENHFWIYVIMWDKKLNFLEFAAHRKNFCEWWKIYATLKVKGCLSKNVQKWGVGLISLREYRIPIFCVYPGIVRKGC